MAQSRPTFIILVLATAGITISTFGRCDQNPNPPLPGYTGQTLAQPNSTDPTPASTSVGGGIVNILRLLAEANALKEAIRAVPDTTIQLSDTQRSSVTARLVAFATAYLRLELDVPPSNVFVFTERFRPSVSSEKSSQSLGVDIGSYLDGWDVGFGFASNSSQSAGIAIRQNLTRELRQFAREIREYYGASKYKFTAQDLSEVIALGQRANSYRDPALTAILQRVVPFDISDLFSAQTANDVQAAKKKDITAIEIYAHSLNDKEQDLLDSFEAMNYALHTSPFIRYVHDLTGRVYFGEGGVALSKHYSYGKNTLFWLVNVAQDTTNLGGSAATSSEWHERLGFSVGFQTTDIRAELQKVKADLRRAANGATVAPRKIQLSKLQCGVSYQLPNKITGYELGPFVRLRDPYHHVSLIIRGGVQGPDKFAGASSKSRGFVELGLSIATGSGKLGTATTQPH